MWKNEELKDERFNPNLVRLRQFDDDDDEIDLERFQSQLGAIKTHKYRAPQCKCFDVSIPTWCD